MPNSPAPIQPVETPDLSPALLALDDIERAFILGGTRAEFNRAAKLILPFVNGTPYEVILAVCDCADLEVYYLRDYTKPGSWFYGVCHAHRLQPLGGAWKCPRLARSNDGGSDRTTRRRVSGYTTIKHYHARGL
jgi:hypothetical protein